MSKLNVLSTTKARDILPAIIEEIKDHNRVFVLGRRDVPEVIMIKYPTEYSPNASDIVNLNTYSHSFDFLNDEPDLYKVNAKKTNGK